MPLIRLSEAVEHFRREEAAYSNSYDWYRRQAHRAGQVWIGGLTIPAYKQSGGWYVDDVDLERSFNNHRNRIAERKAATIDYRNHVLCGGPGSMVETDWGGYTISHAFHLKSVSGMRPYDGYEGWYCNTCWKPAGTERNKEECHTCSDWRGCGRDCTLSQCHLAKGNAVRLVGAVQQVRAGCAVISKIFVL